jgi:hypothetical protein
MAGDVRPITDDTVTGTGTIQLDGHLFGGFDLNCDGTNTGTIIVRDENVTGKVIINSNSVTGKTVIAPFRCTSGVIYYSVSGTLADAMLYEWVE